MNILYIVHVFCFISFLRILYNVFWSYPFPSLLLLDLPPLPNFPPFVSSFYYFLKNPSSSLYLSIYSCVCGLPLECSWSTTDHTLKENRLTVSQHLPIAPQWEVGCYTHLLSPYWGFVWFECDCSHSTFYVGLMQWVHMCICPPVSGK